MAIVVVEENCNCHEGDHNDCCDISFVVMVIVVLMIP